MNRESSRRILVMIGVTAGLVTITAGQASAGLVLQNHSEPAVRPR